MSNIRISNIGCKSKNTMVILALPVIFPSEKSVLNLYGTQGQKKKIHICELLTVLFKIKFADKWHLRQTYTHSNKWTVIKYRMYANQLPWIEKKECSFSKYLTRASVRSSVLWSVENFNVSDFFPLPFRNVRANSDPCPLPTGLIPQMSP